MGPLVWGLWPHIVGSQVGVSQNNTLNLIGGGLVQEGSETICDGAAEVNVSNIQIYFWNRAKIVNQKSDIGSQKIVYGQTIIL